MAKDPHCIYWMNISVNRHHSCKCVGHVILAPQIQPTCCIRCSPIKWGKLSWLAFTKKIQEGSHVRKWVIWLLQLCKKNVLIPNFVVEHGSPGSKHNIWNGLCSWGVTWLGLGNILIIQTEVWSGIVLRMQHGILYYRTPWYPDITQYSIQYLLRVKIL